MPPIAIVASDLHLQPGAWLKRPEIAGDSYYAFEQLVDAAIQYQVPLVLAGDLTDIQRPAPEVVAEICRQSYRMQNARLPVYYLRGQHDGDPSWFSVHFWAHSVNRTQFMLGSFRCYGLDWHSRGQILERLRDVPCQTQLLFAHQCWQDFMGEGRHDGCAFADVPYATHLFTGDYHKHLRHQSVGATSQPLMVYSPGSTCMQDISEPPEKGYFLLHEEPAGFLRVDSQRLNSRGFAELSIRTPDELDAFCSDAEQILFRIPRSMVARIAVPLVRIAYREDLPDVYARLTAALVDKPVHAFLDVIEVVNETVVDFDAAPPNAFDTLANALDQLSPPPNPTNHIAMALLEQVDPAAEITAQYETFVANHPGVPTA